MTPAVAIFATNARWVPLRLSENNELNFVADTSTSWLPIKGNANKARREAYRGTEFAGKILADAGLDVVFKVDRSLFRLNHLTVQSDHPVLDSRYLVYEAAQVSSSVVSSASDVSTGPPLWSELDSSSVRLTNAFDIY